MLLPRIIPCLLLSGNRLVKTIRFKSPTYVGDPINAIRIFNDKEVDELVLLDIDATRNKAEPNYRLIEQIAGECFMPLAYGGGIKTLEQAKTIISLGVEKVIINAATLESTSLIPTISDFFGAQAVVGSLDVKRTIFGRLGLYSYVKGRNLLADPLSHARKLVTDGAGEILLNSVDRDGLRSGYDLDMISAFSRELEVPMIACGGAGTVSDLVSAVDTGGASAASAGSMFVFQGKHRAVLITYPSQEEILREINQRSKAGTNAR